MSGETPRPGDERAAALALVEATAYGRRHAEQAAREAVAGRNAAAAWAHVSGLPWTSRRAGQVTVEQVTCVSYKVVAKLMREGVLRPVPAAAGVDVVAALTAATVEARLMVEGARRAREAYWAATIYARNHASTREIAVAAGVTESALHEGWRGRARVVVEPVGRVG